MPSGLSEEPWPSRSGAMTRSPCAASGAIARSQVSASEASPCSSTIGGPSAGRPRRRRSRGRPPAPSCAPRQARYKPAYVSATGSPARPDATGVASGNQARRGACAAACRGPHVGAGRARRRAPRPRIDSSVRQSSTSSELPRRPPGRPCAAGPRAASPRPRSGPCRPGRWACRRSTSSRHARRHGSHSFPRASGASNALASSLTQPRSTLMRPARALSRASARRGGSCATVRKKSSICLTTSVKSSKSTGFVT